MTKRIISLLLLLCMLFPLTSCATDTDSKSNPTQPFDTEERSEAQDTQASKSSDASSTKYGVTIKDTTVYMFVGESHRLSYDVDKSKLQGTSVKWSSSTDCVSVDGGIVSAMKEGYSYVSASEGNSCLICVLPENMPTISINTSNQPVDSKDAYTACTVTMETDNSDYAFSNVSAGIKVRGNSTATYDKKPYRIKFDSKRNLLGMNSGNEFKSWVLLAEWLDDSLVRNTVSFSLASMILGEYSSDWRYVSLNINGQFKGVYVLCEQSQINDDRIDIEEAGAKSTSLMSGYLFEADASTKYDSNSMFKIYHSNYKIKNLNGKEYTWTCNDNGEMLQYISLKNEGYSSDQLLFSKYYLRAVFDIIYNATYNNKAYVFRYNFLENPDLADEFLDVCKNGIDGEKQNDFSNGIVESKKISPQEAVEAVVDIESLARMYILSEMICNSDDLKKSFYLWVDFSKNGSGKLTFGCPWDHDGAIVAWPGNNKDYSYQKTNKYFAAERNPWYVMIMCNPWFVKVVKEQWQDLYEKNNGYKTVIDLIPKISETYENEFAQEYQRWSYWRTNDLSAEIQKTQKWLTDRIAWMNSKFGADSN